MPGDSLVCTTVMDAKMLEKDINKKHIYAMGTITWWQMVCQIEPPKQSRNISVLLLLETSGCLQEKSPDFSNKSSNTDPVDMYIYIYIRYTYNILYILYIYIYIYRSSRPTQERRDDGCHSAGAHPGDSHHQRCAAHPSGSEASREACGTSAAGKGQNLVGGLEHDFYVSIYWE